MSRNIAVLLTCHNRAPKTEACLKSLVASYRKYQEAASNQPVSIEVFLTDDACTDDTVARVTKVLDGGFPLHVIKGDGNLFWSNGMIAAWREAQKTKDWDFYLLLNDDTVLFPEALSELFKTHEHCLGKYGKAGLYSGITCAKGDPQTITYGGDVWKNWFLGTSKRLPATGVPQMCDMANANMLLVSKNVVESVGIFYDGFAHSCADFDYTIMSRKHGFPVLVTATVCGECEFDHLDGKGELRKLCTMTLAERKAFYSNPLHSKNDHITFVRRCSPFRLPAVVLARYVHLYFPKFYYWLDFRK